MGRSAARGFCEPKHPAWSRMILALATNVRCSVTIDRLAARKFERASDRNWPPVSDSTQTHSPTVASRPGAAGGEWLLRGGHLQIDQIIRCDWSPLSWQYPN